MMQVALMNLSSADLNYLIRANFPFYTEQFDPRAEAVFQRRQSSDEFQVDISTGGTLSLGPTTGRRYPINTERPAFISPPAEPVKVSMEKQEQIKKDIRELINLNLIEMGKGETPEEGLAFIALELEHAENQIGQIWSMYENSKDYPTVSYPSEFSSKTDEERHTEAKEEETLIPIIPSKTYHKEAS